MLLDLTSLNKAITSLENAIMVFDENVQTKPASDSFKKIIEYWVLLDDNVLRWLYF